MIAPTLLCVPVAGLVPLSMPEANRLLDQWGHYLGPCRRPFAQEGWMLDVAGEPVSVAVSASTVSATVASYGRREVVELARLCSAPDHRWATRPMLRLWREVAVPRWGHWPVVAAVAYSQSSRHEGNLYRWDGWQLASEQAGSPGGGSWSTRRNPDHPARGKKRLWVWKVDR